MNEKWEVIIIGAGSAGLAALREVEKTTREVVMINDGAYGTTCARVGCMPSKAMIEIARAFHARHTHEAFGIRGSDALTIDLPAVMRRIRSLRDRFVAGTLEATNALGERSISGRARLRGPHQVEVAGRVLEARRIIIATGSRPRLLRPWQALGERVLTTDSIFELATLPRRMAIVGLGAIGIEFAQALSRLGIQVSAFGQDQTLAGITDDKVNATLRTILDREFAVHTGDSVELASAGEGVRVRAGETELEVDRVLAAIGRVPNVDDMGLETLGVALDEHGMPPYDPETTQIADLPIFLAGDANGHAPLLHEAADEGYIAGVNAVAAATTCFQRRTALGIVFAEPAVAFVGQRLGELSAQDVVIGEVSFARQGRAVTAQSNEGVMRIYASRADARLLGAEMCAPAAEHMVHFLALAIGQGLTVHELLRTPFYHPVLEEGLRTALRDLARQFEGRSSDLAACNAFQAEALD